MDQTKKLEDKNEEVKPHIAGSYTAEDFIKEFEALTVKLGFTIVPSLTWVARDDSTWSTKINLTVGALPRVEKN